MIDPGSLRTEDLLDEIHRQLEQTRGKRRGGGPEERTGSAAPELAEKLQNIENERLAVLEEARRQSLRELDDLRAEMNDIRREARASSAQVTDRKAALKKVGGLEEKVSEPLDKKNFVQPVAPRPLRVGDRVHLRNLKMDGVVLEINEENVEVQIGKMRVKADLRNIERSAKGAVKAKSLPVERRESEPTETVPVQLSPGIELHLRGMRAEDALDQLDKYLDNAYAAGLPFARIVHGKGTGILRQVVRQALSDSPLVNRWENAMDNEGGDGVTIVHFKSD
jgi:DNA mismatch repair protein MutS2